MGKRIGGEGGALAQWFWQNRRNSATMPADSGDKFERPGVAIGCESWGKRRGRAGETGESRGGGWCIWKKRGKGDGSLGGGSREEGGRFGEEASDRWAPLVREKKAPGSHSIVSRVGHNDWAGLGCPGPILSLLFFFFFLFILFYFLNSFITFA
jgi:hypothetical protein